ncbi:RagB/SusD family nutrient uptake outer membrane protein [Dyadobacter sp. CY312]|uniref:RagB/SusD family nutrient uptake outer membrane protein n=1 Tax=Dyadobacter sp. CY312 TaxID=2907303 RepID=UPI001F186B4E|nr:RagB/SusD family nutrient uptake outer membrane protein [Dyadobacter sp. CY312]MCE7040343.1 RagB/SusD family nutrient uptake outer membrane protein [Dyadobacter sp. CY312]
MKAFKYILATSLIFSLGSCGNFLEVEPRASISDQQTIIDKVSSETAIRGAYDSFRSYYSVNLQSIGYLSGDNIQWTGSQSQVQEFINHSVNAENATISGVWNGIYTTLNRINHVIDKVPAVSDPLLTDALRNQIVGEAYFLRALGYFDLARIWGGVPIITKPTLSPQDNRGIARATQAEVYSQVIADLELAEPLLPATTDRFRATRKTVWALKARYYLYQKNYAKAEEYADKVIADASYKLVKPYNAFFANDARGTEESVFEIFYSINETNSHRGQWQPQQNGGTRQWAPNDAFVALVNDPAIGGTRNTLVAKDNQNRWYGNLYYRSPATDPTFVIRIAELYLIRAEARASLDKPAGAIADLDAVRERAGLAKTTASTKADILLAIENERRIEFALEPHRWFDLVRTERAAAVLNVNDPNKLLLPIPAEQLLTDKALKQNPGY